LPENNFFSLDEDLALLSQSARKAGEIALRFFGRDLQVWMKNGDKSPVSEADFAVDSYLKQTLLQERPDYGWLSEESRDERPVRTYRRSFVIDPIDGTRGFLNGLAQWCISVAIIENGQPICGVLECPAIQEHYSAHSGVPALLNNTPLLPRMSSVTKKIRLSCLPSLAGGLPPDLEKEFEFTSYIPSLAYRLVLLAKAELDIVLVRPNSHDWDIAAVDIILRQSGILLTTFQNAPPSYGMVPFVHDFLFAGHTYHKQIISQYLDFFKSGL